MTLSMSSVHALSDHDLLAQVHCAMDGERQATAHLIALLTELDARRLYLAEGCSSLFTYCTQILHLSEHAAYGRIEAARAVRRFPVILERLADGMISLTAIGLLAPHLTTENHVEVLDAARHKSKRDVEHLVACLRPRPDVPSVVRKLPERKAMPVAFEPGPVEEHEHQAPPQPAPSVASQATRLAEVRALAPERYKIQFTVSRETYDQLRRAQDLLRHTIPNGDPAAIFERALTLLVTELSKTRLAAPDRPRASHAPARASRHIPATVKRAVWQRDGGRCAFKGSQGRCTETGFLEFHHLVPYARGGKTSTENLELRCRAHNDYEAKQYFSASAPVVRETRVAYRVGSPTRSGPSCGRDYRLSLTSATAMDPIISLKSFAAGRCGNGRKPLG